MGECGWVGLQTVDAYLSAHLQLDDLDLVRNHGWFVSLVECVVEHLDRIGVELVGKAGPLEGERHGRLLTRMSFSAMQYGESVLVSVRKP